MEPDWRSEPKTWIAIIVALLLWASAFAGIRAGLVDYGPGEIALLRFGTASVALGSTRWSRGCACRTAATCR